jgi:DNA-binding SARP family transcriptional activator
MLDLHETLSTAPASQAASMLCLMGPPQLRWRNRSNAAWAYAKLPALLAVLGDAAQRPVRRNWLAALLWPERDAASLRRALYDLRRQLRSGRAGPGLVLSSRDALWLSPLLPVDLAPIDAAAQAAQAGSLTVPQAQAALALWRGEFAAGIELVGVDDFALWLMQARARWERRALRVALALADLHLHAGRAGDALAVAQRAAERVPDDEAAHAVVWRCQVAAGAGLQAAQDWRRYQLALAAQGLAPSPALCALAAGLGLAPPVACAPVADTRATARLPASFGGDAVAALAVAATQALRGGLPVAEVEPLLARCLTALQAAVAASRAVAPAPADVLLLRRAIVLRLMHAPWHDAMAPLAAMAEALLCRPLEAAARFDLVQTLATWHGWMGRGLRAEVLLRTLGEPGSALLQSPAAQVRWEMTLALCHSCSTGDPQRSIRAARRGLKLGREGAVPGARQALLLLVANAALNRGGAADARVAERALAQAAADGPLRHFDLVNHLQLSALHALLHGRAEQALATAEQGERLAQAVPFPLQGLSCTLLALSARLLLHAAGPGPGDLGAALAAAVALARRIGSEGYLMNALLLHGVQLQRSGQAAAAAAALAEARAIARANGVVRVRKIPPALLDGLPLVVDATPAATARNCR